MAMIKIDNISVETEDIDLIVRHKSLSEIDALVKADEEFLKEFPDSPWWKHRLETSQLAREIAEWMWENDFQTVEPPIQTERDRGLYALTKYYELEKRVNELQRLGLYLQNKINERKDEKRQEIDPF